MKKVRHFSKKSMAVLLSCIMLATGFLLPVTSPVTAFADEVPKGYTAISSADDLELIRTKPSGKYYFTSDIDLSETQQGGSMDKGGGWVPIPKFTGTINGNGHIIKEMNVYGDVKNAGFIAQNYGKITDLHFEDVNIDVCTDFKDNVYCGAVCGYNGDEISLCSVTGRVRAAVFTEPDDSHELWMGGLAGKSSNINTSYSSADVKYCIYRRSGELDGTVDLRVGVVGGQSTFTDCYNAGGNVERVSYQTIPYIDGSDFVEANYPTTSYLGGIGGQGAFTHCANFHDGRITGRQEDPITDCYCTESMSAWGYSGQGHVISAPFTRSQGYKGFDLENVWEIIGTSTLQLRNNPEFYPEKLTFSAEPLRVNFTPVEEFACDGTLLLEYSNGEKEEVPLQEEMVSGYDLSKEGEQNLTVTYKGLTIGYTITVSSVEAASIILDSYNIEMNRGDTAQLTATITPPDATFRDITWTTSDDKVAVADKNGLITGVGAGEAEITATTANGLSATCKVKVYIPATKIWFEESIYYLNDGEVMKLVPKYEPADATPKLNWSSTNTVISVDQEGNVTGKITKDRLGGIIFPRTKITVTTEKTGSAASVSAECSVHMVGNVKELSLSNDTLTVPVGQLFDISCRAVPENITDNLDWEYTGNLLTEVARGGEGNNIWLRLIAERPGTCTITAKASNGMEKSCLLTVQAEDISNVNMSPEYTRVLYDGQAKTPKIYADYNGHIMTEGVDFSVSYRNNTNVGVAEAIVTGTGDKFTGQRIIKFLIYDISGCSMMLDPDFFIYDGTAKRPNITVIDDRNTLSEGVHYTVTYENNVNPGTARAVVSGINGYTGTKTLNFTISREDRVDLSNCDVTLDPTQFTYDGGEKRPTITAFNGHNKLIRDQDFLVTYYDNINVGTARAVLTGIGSYTGTRELAFTINPPAKRDISGFTATLSQSSYDYDGSAKTPTVTLKNDALVLTQGVDYTVDYSNNIEPGTATVTVNGLGSYTGSRTLNFTIKKKEEVKPPSTDSDSDTDSDIPQGRERFIWGVDNYNFINHYVTGHFTNDIYRNQINSFYLNALKENLTPSEYEVIFNGVDKTPAWLDDHFNGSCYGMSSTTLLAREGYFPFSTYQPGAGTLHDLDYPAKNSLTYPDEKYNLSSLITYYQMLQVKDATQQKYRTYPKRSHGENIKEIISLLDTNNTVVIGFKKAGWGGHAILGIGYEYGDYTKHDISYQGRIKICDPNKATNDDENYYIYFNTTTYDWEIPAYDNMGSKYGAVFNYSSGDIDLINQGGYLSGTNSSTVTNYIARINAYAISDERSVTKVQESNGHYAMMNNAPGDIEEEYEYILGSESEGVLGYNLYDSNASYKVTQNKTDPMELSITYDNCFMSGSSEAGRSVTFDKSGCVEVRGEKSDYSMSITSNDECPTDWFTVKVKGDNSEYVSLSKGTDGWIISGDNLENVNVFANNKYNEAETVFTTMYDSALIYEIDQNTIGVAIDADGNGTYETTIVPEPEQRPSDTDTGTDTDPDKPTVKKGDVNKDGKVTAKDSMLIQRYAIHLAKLDDDQLIAADINGDNRVTNKDALSILRHTIGYKIEGIA